MLDRMETKLRVASARKRLNRGGAAGPKLGLYSLARSTWWFATGYPADQFARLLKESQSWSRPRLEEYRDGKLRDLIAHCYDRVPYYRKVMDDRGLKPSDITSAKELYKLPVLTKDIVRRRAAELLAKDVGRMATSWTMTGGTTGEPMRICKNQECAAWSGMCYERGLSWAGKGVNEPVVQLFGGSLGFESSTFTSRMGKLLARDLYIPAFEMNAATIGDFIERIERSRCRFVIGYASAIYRLAVLAKESNRKLEFAAVFPTAELMLPDWEEVISETFQCAVLPYYGCGEVNSLGFSAPGRDDYLIPEEHALIEILKADDDHDLSGSGQFLVTDLDNYAMPVLRYANGDAGKIGPPDGAAPFARIERLDGRYNSLLMTDRGELISGVIGTHIFRLTSSIKTYRIFQEEPLRIVVKVVPKSGAISLGDESLLRHLFTKYLGERMRIEIQEANELPPPPSGKSVFVVNHCLA